MLGSHNSLSYLKSNNLLQRWAKCQEVAFAEQYNHGVRCFDVRIKFEKGKPKIVHNNIDYKGGETLLNSLFSFMNAKGDCWLRLILDVRKTPKNAEYLTTLFKKYIFYIQENCPNIKWAEAITYWNWDFIVEPKLRIIENHASVTNNVGLFKTPKMYAQKNNAKIKEEQKEVVEADNDVLLIDFVNL